MLPLYGHLWAAIFYGEFWPATLSAIILGTATGVGKEIPEFGILALGCLIQAFAFSTIFRHWGNEHYNIMSGLKFGILIGILVGLGNGLIDYATSNMLDMTGALGNGMIYVFFFATMGVITGLIYNKVQ